MFLIFALRRHDVLPTGDLGIRNAIRKAYGLEAMPLPGEIEAMAERWRPFCTVASWYLGAAWSKRQPLIGRFPPNAALFNVKYRCF